MKSWRTHWDYQLYKVLELQYQKGLESLNENLAEISVELVFKQQKLQFRPSFEVVRSNYYSAMRNFIKYPLNFGGVGDTDIFKVCPLVNKKVGTTQNTIKTKATFNNFRFSLEFKLPVNYQVLSSALP